MKNCAAMLLLAAYILPAGFAQGQDATGSAAPVPVPKAAATVQIGRLIGVYYKTKEFPAKVNEIEAADQKKMMALMQSSANATEDDRLAVRKAVDALERNISVEIQAFQYHNRKEVRTDLAKVIHDYAAAHGIDVVAGIKGGSEVASMGFGNVLPGTIDLKKIPDITDPIIDQLYANDPAKYTDKAPVPVEQPAPASIAVIDVDRMAASSDKTKADLAAAAADKNVPYLQKIADFQAQLATTTDAQAKEKLEQQIDAYKTYLSNVAMSKMKSVKRQGLSEVRTAIDDYASEHQIYILDVSPVADENGYPKIAPGSPNLKGVPDITDEMIARLNAAQKPAAPPAPAPTPVPAPATTPQSDDKTAK